MFRKVHLQLTLLFTIVSTLILTAMSAFYLYFNNQNLYNNAMLSFQSDINTFTANFEKDTTISYDWLLNLQDNYDYSFYIYDNGIPFQFTQDTKTETQRSLIEEIKTYYHENYSNTLKNSYTAVHTEFSYHSKHESYIIGTITIPGKKSDSEIYIIYSLKTIEAQIRQLYIRFVIIIIISVIILFAFSWFYTKRLLKPILESQIKQAQFVAAASHEIRNPVNTILSALNAIDKGNAAEQQEFIAIAKKEGKRLSLLTDDMLMLARSDNHAYSLSLQPTELDTLTLDCYEAFTALAREKQLHFSVELPEYPIIAEHIDGERIRQVIAILLDNAISYTNENGYIVLRCTETKKAYCIEVIDNGIGIDDADKNRIFDRFYRVDAARKSKSHFGLGLCIAREIMELHHGTISVKDTPGGGATFTVTLIR